MKAFAKCFFLISLLSFYPLSAEKPQYQLSVCAIFQNEAPYLREWIEYYKLLGVEHFYLYNNESTDDYLEVLEPYIQAGEIDLFDWKSVYEPPRSLTQVLAYNDVLPIARKETKWLAVVDLDEFILPMQTDSLTEFLKEYEEFGGVVVNWQMYGTSGVHSLKPGELLTEKLVYKFHQDHSPNKHVKSIINPSRVTGTISSHRYRYIPGYYGVDADKQFHAPHMGGKTPELKIDKIRINHYWCKTEEFFYAIKLPRREKIEGRQRTPEEIDHTLKRGNEVYDPCILRLVPALKKRLEGSNR